MEYSDYMRQKTGLGDSSGSESTEESVEAPDDAAQLDEEDLEKYLPPEDVIGLTGVSEEKLRELYQAGMIDSKENEEGETLIKVESVHEILESMEESAAENEAKNNSGG